MRLRLVLDPGKRRYEGTATTPSSRWTITATIAPDESVSIAGDAPAEIAEYARRVVRIAVRNTEGALPRTIQRWRAEKE